MAATIAEGALRRYGRANYDVSARLQMVGDDLYIRTRASLDDDEVVNVNDRLSRATYSQSVKSFPRRGPSSPRISVIIASSYAPFAEVSPKQMDQITSRLLKPTLVSKLRETVPVPRSPPATPQYPARIPSFRIPFPPTGILRTHTQGSATAPTSADTSRTEEKIPPSKPESSPEEEPAKDVSPTPKVRFALKGAKGRSRGKPETDPVRSKSAPARAQRTLPSVTCPKAYPKPVKSKKELSGSGKPASPRKLRRSCDTRRKSNRGKQSDAARSQSSLSDRPKRLGFIATILEADDEYEY